MTVGTRLGLPVAKVTTTVAIHNARPPRKIRPQPGPWLAGRALDLAVWALPAAALGITVAMPCSSLQSGLSFAVVGSSSAVELCRGLADRLLLEAVGLWLAAVARAPLPAADDEQGDAAPTSAMAACAAKVTCSAPV